MAFSYACLTLQRVVIPAFLVLAALSRPVGISFVYLLMFFISPFIPVATTRNFKGSVTAYLIILIALSSILLLCHIALQLTIILLNIDTLFGTCSFTEQLLRHVGFIDFRNLKALAIVEWLAPEVVIFITSLTVYFVTKTLTRESVPGQLENGEADVARASLEIEASEANGIEDLPSSGSSLTSPSKRVSSDDRPNFDALIKISPLFCLATLFFAAVLRPSVPGGFYFLIFLLSGSYWATFQSLQRGFAVLLRFVMVVIVLHTLCIVSYQTPWMQQHLSSSNLIARLIGLEPLVSSTCQNDIRIIVYDTNYKVDSFLSPIVLFFSFYALALTTKNLIKPRIVAKPAMARGQQQLENGSNKFNRQLSLMTQTSRGSKKDSWTKTQRLNVSLRREHRPKNTEPTETTPLVRHTTRKTRSSLAESTSAVASGNDIPLDAIGQQDLQPEDSTASIFDQISYGIISIGGFIYQNSYIFTNILMMAWSIVYHSWLTFVLLLWANVLWMIPNQRKAMMRSSPFIVIYAEVLLVAQYIYGMNLTNEELPAKVDTAGINLSQIGLDRPQEDGMQPCVPLIVKTSFLLMFWVTLRQFFKEKTDKRRDSKLDDTISPLQQSVGPAESEYARHDTKKTSKFLKKIGDIIKNLLVRLWIWLLVLVIFLCAITGKQMTSFRICYMALFLFFLLVFQSSSKVWVKVMYGFWIFLIFYAMTILILIYTYQFDKFDQYWKEYLDISPTLQTDIGLEQYKTKDLFLHLVSPTIIVILTVIQVHYFHKRFIASLEQRTIQPPTESLEAPPSTRPPSLKSQVSLVRPAEGADFEKSVRDLIRLFFKRVKRKAKRFFKNMKGVFWRCMELHFIKVVYITAFVCSVSEVCLLHVIFVALCLIGLISRNVVQKFISRMISFIVSIIILTKMIYQIAYLDHSHYDTNCFNVTGAPNNSAIWFGLDKASPATGGLMGLLKKYIIYMVMVTLHAVVTLRQFQMRSATGTQNTPVPKVLFPKVVRADAEKNLEGMTKYLFNYGYYKFGLEISMIMLVTTITYRQDIIAVVYAFWLFILLLCDRSKCAKLWGIFQCFIAILIFIQYLVLLGLPPSLCINYPWSGSVYSESIQRWAMLPGSLHYNHVSKLICDFILLLLVNRQKRVFYIESRQDDSVMYPGGNNKSVIEDIANLGIKPFENPTRDFLSNIRNYLDIFKNAILCGFYWTTLAVVFLAGTNISDLLAIGYLVGAFIFLWQGSDFYLRPINVVIRRWNWLIAYNVTNIVIKTCLQMAGCLFMQQLSQNCCWLVHILGISCTTAPARPPDEENYPNSTCPLTSSQMFLVWDAVCFGFLLLQLRIFKSHYFCHIIIDTKANTLLASRGAEIIEDLRQKQIEYCQNHETEVLHKIKRKMEKIRATQQKMLRPIDKPTHFDELTESAEIAVAPLAHNSSFSSCQGSGYHTPDDDEVSSSSSSSSTTAATHSETSTEEEQAQLIVDGANELELPSLPQEIRIECDDFASDAHTDYADVYSLSDVGDNALAEEYCGIRLQLPDDGHDQNQPQLNTPSTDVMTLPLDGFLDVNRLSLGSAPNSDLVAPLREDSEESFEVFSPPPYDSLQPPMHTLYPPSMAGGALTSCSLSVNVSGGSSVISSNLTANGGGGGGGPPGRHRRQSSVNAVSWNETVSIKCTPKETSTVSGEVSEDLPVTLRQKSLHRRHLSMGNASYSMDADSSQPNGRRRYSNISSARDESYQRAAARPNSWGPVEYGYPVPTSRVHKRKEIKYHPQAVRAGDYYMFEDMDDKFELDIIEDEVDFMEESDNLDQSEKKMTRRKTLFDVWKDMNAAEYRRQIYVRQRSYASAPGSRIGIKIDEELEFEGQVGVRTSTLSEPLDYVHCSTDEYFAEREGKAELPKPEMGPSTSKEVPSEEPSESKKKPDSAEVTEKESDDDLNENPIVRLLEAFLVSLTIRLNRFSRNYRYVNKILAVEKKTLKDSSNIHRLGRVGAAAMFNFLKKSIESDENEDASVPPSSSTRASNNALNNTNMPQNNNTNLTTTTTNNVPSQSQSLDQPQQPPHVVDIIELPLDAVDAKDARKETSSSNTLSKARKSDALPEIRIKAPSFDRSHDGSGSLSKQRSYEKVDSTANYDFEEDDFAARDHNIIVEVLISTWYAILSNTDLICYIVIFMNQVVNASVISLPLPIMVFLWGTLSLPRPSKTFWVTLIAYTQAIVLIKCIFQFKLIWLGYHNRTNQPLAPAKIMGVELHPNYALYDLLLLLVLFFHRFILKSQGLWKSEYKDNIMVLNSRSNSVTGDADFKDIDGNALMPGDNTSESGIEVRSFSPVQETGKYLQGIQRLKRAKYASSLRKFFFNLVNKSRLPSDVYALMFLCDFINFFVLLFGFTAFGSQQSEGEGGGVQTYLAENKVPIPFLIMLLLQFILIVIDRALYLRKALVHKIIFHFLSVIGIHIWMFFVVPAVTERSFYSLAPPIIFYIIKCFYMLLSSYQIKCGYPKRILGNFLTKGFSLAHQISFKVYMLIPFLYELRTILDWVSTDTTMTLFDWLKMEDIFSDIFFIKCSRQMETDFPAIRAQKKAVLTKLLMGGTVIFLIVLSIWGPLCLFALGNAVGQSNVPYEVSVKIRIGPYDPIYETNNRESMFTFNQKLYADMQDAYVRDKSATAFLSGYDAEDISVVKLAGNSPSLWNISPPDKQRLLVDLKNGVELTARFTFSFTRIPPAKGLIGTVGSEVVYTMDESFQNRSIMIDMLEGKVTDQTVIIPAMIPKFLKVLNSGDINVVPALMPPIPPGKERQEYRPLDIRMRSGTNGIWWEISDYCQDDFYKVYLSKLPMSDCESGIVMYTFNDKKFPSTFSFLTAGGIIGLYTTFVLLASRILKSFISGQNRKIMFEDLPYVDRVLQLCLDIYLVREALEFALEEDLFAKLIFLYRSPETMIKWTRPKEEIADDETDTESVRSRNSARRTDPQ